jgi:hypothetical protein
MKTIAIASFAVLMLGASAALAQPYGYGNRPGNQPTRTCQNPDRAYDLEQFRRGHIEHVMNCLGDPATGMHISQQEYLNKYPWSDVSTWVYNPAMDVWADNTPDSDRLFAQSWAQGDRRYSPNYSSNSRNGRYRN